jgi:hypothetical protein
VREDLPVRGVELLVACREGAFACWLDDQTSEMWEWREEDIPTDLLPTMAILRCFCWGGMVLVDGELSRLV